MLQDSSYQSKNLVKCILWCTVNTVVQVKKKTLLFFIVLQVYNCINVFMGSIISFNQNENHKPGKILHTCPLKTSGNITEDHQAPWISSSVVAALTLSVNTAPPVLTWLLFSARSVSTSSLRLKGFPTSTVILCGHRQSSEVDTRSSCDPQEVSKNTPSPSYLADSRDVGLHVWQNIGQT